MDDILAKLAAPFPPEIISWRVGSTTQDKKKGMALAYIDARDVQDRLNAVCGLNWQVRNPWAAGNKLACEIGIRLNGEWIWRGDGAGDSDVEAEKGAFSDAFKRAAVRWGIGRYLYDMDSPWVELKPMGRSYVIADGELPKLRALLARKAGTTPKPVETASESYAIAVKPLPDGKGSDWPRWKAVMLKAITQADSVAKIDKLAHDNQAAMDGLKAHSGPAWGDLSQVFAAKRQQLEGKKAA